MTNSDIQARSTALSSYAKSRNALRHHVTGAIERGEAEAVVELPEAPEGIYPTSDNPLPWRVECRPVDPEAFPRFWETIAGFNSERVAERYAEDCGKGNRLNRYRVVTVEAGR